MKRKTPKMYKSFGIIFIYFYTYFIHKQIMFYNQLFIVVLFAFILSCMHLQITYNAQIYIQNTKGELKS